MTTIKDKYDEANAVWPGAIPDLTAEESVRAARKLYRFGMRQTFRGKVKITSGRRYTWVRNGVMVVNPEHGWKQLVHMLSHYVHRKVGVDKPHSKQHARLECRMIAEVLNRGWLSGVLANEPEPVLTPADRAQAAICQIDAGIKRWDAKKRRAETALKKLNRKRKYYEINI